MWPSKTVIIKNMWFKAYMYSERQRTDEQNRSCRRTKMKCNVSGGRWRLRATFCAAARDDPPNSLCKNWLILSQQSRSYRNKWHVHSSMQKKTRKRKCFKWISRAVIFLFRKDERRLAYVKCNRGNKKNFHSNVIVPMAMVCVYF